MRAPDSPAPVPLLAFYPPDHARALNASAARLTAAVHAAPELAGALDAESAARLFTAVRDRAARLLADARLPYRHPDGRVGTLVLRPNRDGSVVVVSFEPPDDWIDTEPDAR